MWKCWRFGQIFGRNMSYYDRDRLTNKIFRKSKRKIVKLQLCKLNGNMDGAQISQSYRQCLKTSVGALLLESGFDSSEQLALETVTELLQSFLKELGRSSRAFCELACRTEVLGADVMLALSEMGCPPLGLREYALRIGRKSVSAPIPTNPPKQTSILHTGDKKRPPKTYGIQEGLPDFPDSHSFIRTPTHKQPQADYESVREKAATQKRDVERALSKFIAKMAKKEGKHHSLFNTEDDMFPLISCVDTTVHAEFNTNLAAEAGDSLQVLPYVNALLFRDQIFEEELEYSSPKKAKKDSNSDIEFDNDKSKNEQKVAESNPFLKPVRLPRNALCLPPACK